MTERVLNWFFQIFSQVSILHGAFQFVVHFFFQPMLSKTCVIILPFCVLDGIHDDLLSVYWAHISWINIACVYDIPWSNLLKSSAMLEHMQEIYRRTPMPKCDFNKVAKQLYWNHTLTWVFYYKFAAYFQGIFS